MRGIFSIAALTCFMLLSGIANSENYNLKRVVITNSDASVEDTALNNFTATGTMSINASEMVQNLTYCYPAYGCENVVENAGGTIVSISPNNAKATIKLHADGSVGDLTLLSLSPNIITMYVYDDGTVENHEWEPVSPFSKKILMTNEESKPSTGKIGSGIAKKLRP